MPLRSAFRQTIILSLQEYSQQILERELKDYEITQFFNTHEEFIEHIVNLTVNKLRREIAIYLQEYKNENPSI